MTLWRWTGDKGSEGQANLGATAAREPEKDRRLGEKTGLPEADTAFPIYLAKPWSPDIRVRTVDLHVTW